MTISPFRSQTAARPAPNNPPAPAPTPAPSPAPAPAPPPPPAIDFSNIDCEKKAILLPALNAAAFMVQLQAMGNAAQGGMALTSALAMTFNGNTQASATYTMADPTSLAMNGTGTFGNADFKENWSIDPTTGALLITGSIGSSAEKLAVTAAADGNHIDGTVGSVAVHELVTSVGAGSDARIVFDGTINGVAAHQELSSVQADPNAAPTLHDEGTLGSDPILLDEKETAEDPTSMTLAAQGTLAGTAVTMTHNLQVATPATPSPAPAPQSR